MTPTEYQAQAAALRLRVAAAGLAPWAGADHAADLERVLRAMEASPTTVYVRSSRGERWAVTRLSYSTWLAALGPRAVLGDVRYVVETMEAQP